MNFSVVVKTFRPKFLILSLICSFLGIAVTAQVGLPIPVVPAMLAMLGALLAHISVNTLNEYHDFVSGLDLSTQRTAFSGGSGALPANPEQLHAVLYAGIASLLMIVAIGFYFIHLHDLMLIPLGLVGLMLIVFYTHKINRSPWLCLIAPGLGFGILMVVGTQFVLTGEYWLHTLVIGLIPFLLINNLLLLNQYPDVAADKAVGRYHFPIAYGVKASNTAYFSMWLLSVLILLGLVITANLPMWSLLALLPLCLGLVAWRGMVKYGFDIAEHPQFMAMNVMTSLFTPLCLAISLLI